MAAAAATGGTGRGEKRTGAKGYSNDKVPFFKLFAFADGLDTLLMAAGALGAVGNGFSQPYMTVIFGQLINSISDFMYSKSVLHEVGQVIY